MISAFQEATAREVRKAKRYFRKKSSGRVEFGPEIAKGSPLFTNPDTAAAELLCLVRLILYRRRKAVEKQAARGSDYVADLNATMPDGTVVQLQFEFMPAADGKLDIGIAQAVHKKH